MATVSGADSAATDFDDVELGDSFIGVRNFGDRTAAIARTMMRNGFDLDFLGASFWVRRVIS